MSRSSRMCRMVTGVLRRLPRRVRASGAALVLNHLFAHVFADDTVAFVDGRVIEIHIADLDSFVRLRMDNGMLLNATEESVADLCLSGDMLDLLQLAIRRVSAGTLFAEHKLTLTGNEQLVTPAMAFLHDLGGCNLPGPALRALGRIADRYENGCAATVAALQTH